MSALRPEEESRYPVEHPRRSEVWSWEITYLYGFMIGRYSPENPLQAYALTEEVRGDRKLFVEVALWSQTGQMSERVAVLLEKHGFVNPPSH